MCSENRAPGYDREKVSEGLSTVGGVGLWSQPMFLVMAVGEPVSACFTNRVCVCVCVWLCHLIANLRLKEWAARVGVSLGRGIRHSGGLCWY